MSDLLALAIAFFVIVFELCFLSWSCQRKYNRIVERMEKGKKEGEESDA